MRDAIHDEVTIGTHERRQAHVTVINLQLAALPEKMLDQVHQRRFAQIVCAGLEGDAKYSDASMALVENHPDALLELHLVGAKDRGKQRQLQIEHPSLVGERAQILRQA